MSFKICLLFAFAICSLAKAELDIDALEKELQDAEWTDDPIEFDDSDEEARADKATSSCSCLSHDSCGCCISPKIFGKRFPGCMNVTLHSTETKNVELIEVTAHLLDDQIAQYNFTISPTNKLCTSMPKMKWLSLCLYNNNTVTDDLGFVSCSSLDLMVKSTAALEIKFSCVQFKDDQLSFFDQKKTGRNAWLSMKVKNPLRHLVKYFKEHKDEIISFE